MVDHLLDLGIGRAVDIQLDLDPYRGEARILWRKVARAPVSL